MFIQKATNRMCHRVKMNFQHEKKNLLTAVIFTKFTRFAFDWYKILVKKVNGSIWMKYNIMIKYSIIMKKRIFWTTYQFLKYQFRANLPSMYSAFCIVHAYSFSIFFANRLSIHSIFAHSLSIEYFCANRLSSFPG